MKYKKLKLNSYSYRKNGKAKDIILKLCQAIKMISVMLLLQCLMNAPQIKFYKDYHQVKWLDFIKGKTITFL